MIIAWLSRLLGGLGGKSGPTEVAEVLKYLDDSLTTIDKKLQAMSDEAKIADQITRSGAVSLAIVSLRSDGSMLVTHGYGKNLGLVVGEDVPKGAELYSQLMTKIQDKADVVVLGSTAIVNMLKESRYLVFLTVERGDTKEPDERFCVILVIRETNHQELPGNKEGT